MPEQARHHALAAPVEWWGSECRACLNATPEEMVCDSCGSDEFTVALWVERGLRAAG